MKFTDFITKTAIIENLISTDKKATLEEMVKVLKGAYNLKNIKTDMIMNALLKREKIGSTGIGNGVAVPHAKIDELTNVIAAFGRSQAGIDFNAIDGAPVHLVFLILAPTNQADQNIQALQRVSQAIRLPTFGKFLRDAKKANDIFEIFKDTDEKLK